MFEKVAPEFEGIKGWINSDPLTIKSLRGKVVLLDFWTYSCVNCLRSLPHMKAISERFAKNSFVLIGVHTPEFVFEKDMKNVQDAVKRLGIKYPVALDSGNTTWTLYGNRFWPRQTLIDPEGRIRFEHVGEGGYEDMESWITRLLEEVGEKVPGEVKKVGQEMSFALSPEIYLGSKRSTGLGSSKVCDKKGCERFVDQPAHRIDVVYLDGEWKQEDEFVRHLGEDCGYVLVKYTAKIANAVLATEGKSFKAEVFLDGKYLTDENAGKDVKIVDGSSYVIVHRPDMYELVRTEGMETHELKIITDSDEFIIYTFTFG